jgi:hypothetical protein
MICPITQGFTYDCENPLQPGVENRFILMNLQDIASYTITDNKVTDITLKGGKQGYLFEGVKQSIKPSYEFVETGLVNGYNHNLQFQIYDIDSDRKEELFKMGVNRFVAIIFNMNVPGNEDGYFEVFGLQSGMETIGLTRINRGVDPDVGYTVTLNTGELVNESKLPLNFFDTDYQTSLAKILALLQTGTNVVFPFTFPFNLA